MRFLLFVPAVLWAQSNLDFRQGAPGETPPGWMVPSVIQAAGYSAELRREGCRSGSGCAVLRAPAEPPAGTYGNLMQAVAAAPYLGKTVRLRASIKVEALAPGASARMWLRVDLPAGQQGFLDNMGDRPITSSEWNTYEIVGEVAPDAVFVNFGVISSGKARVWIDGVSFESVPEAPSEADAAALKNLYARMDAAYQQGDIDAIAALALPDAWIRMGEVRIGLSETLARITDDVRQGSRYTSRSKITGIRFSRDTAVVSVNGESARTSPAGRQSVATISRDTWTRTAAGWKLQESVLISNRPVVPLTGAAAAEAVVAELKQRSVALATVEPGTPAADLAAFGAAAGEARIVALGEATHGTHEFFRMKHRLLEYLVKEKGFTVFALEANWPESLAVDRYIKEGEGSARDALAGMHAWMWQTGEMLDLIEWMRSFNSAPGQHAVLSFTSFDMQTAGGAAEMALDYLKQYASDDAGPAAAAYNEAQDLEARRTAVFDAHAKSAADRAAEVLKIFDSKRAELAKASGPERWRDARQAAAIVVQACTLRIPGKGPAYRDEAMAGNVAWLSGQAYPSEKIVLWAHNSHVSCSAGADNLKPMGAWLRDRYGKQMYVAGFAFRGGQLRAMGTRDGNFTPVDVHTAPASPEGSGDAVLSAAGLPLFFLDMARLAPGALSRWLAEPHLFHDVGSSWALDDPDVNLRPSTLSKLYDGLIFVEEGHAARGLGAR
ncbi:MAG TPA: erythromycin esterase family protein [Bryobacteraceae bacterium]|nr:erythromycin esterase family protein [Bryobacteraceae bacterium]